MKIVGETCDGYTINCDCGAQFSDTGSSGEAMCLSCGATDEVDFLVEAWWQQAGAWYMPAPSDFKPGYGYAHGHAPALQGSPAIGRVSAVAMPLR